MDTTRVATGDRDRMVRVFDLATFSQTVCFQSDTDFGESRLAISPNGKFVACASYDNGTATVFDDAGNKLWRRDKLEDIQVVQFSLNSEFLYCSHNRGLVSAFDTTNGQPNRFNWFTKRVNGSYRLHESSFDDRFLNDRIESSLKLTTKSLKSIQAICRKTFGVLDVTFAPEFVCISESTGPITCYHIDGTHVWELSHDNGVHALDLSYDPERNLFLAITWPYEDGGDQFLLSIRPSTGELVSTDLLPEATSLFFVKNGTLLISTTGEIIETASLNQVGHLHPV